MKGVAHPLLDVALYERKTFFGSFAHRGCQGEGNEWQVSLSWHQQQVLPGQLLQADTLGGLLFSSVALPNCQEH